VLLPFLIFWILIFLARHELGWRGCLIAVALWLGLLFACFYSGLSSYVFVAIQAFIDVVLILLVFKGDIPIR